MTPIPGELTRARPASPVRFLLDWRDDHRELSDANRDAVGRYITAIVEHDPRAREDVGVERELAAELWLRFRDTYDGFVGPFMRSPQEDFGRAISRL